MPETVAPEIGAAPDVTVDSATPTTTVTYATPTVTDNEDPSPEISCTPASGSTFHVGQTTFDASERTCLMNSPGELLATCTASSR